jgi:hypothetical protein
VRGATSGSSGHINTPSGQVFTQSGAGCCGARRRYKRGRCNTFLGQVFATSEGLLWEAMVHGVAEWDLAFRSNAPRAQTSRLPAEFHANCQWLDDGDDDLRARCRRHEPITLPRSAVLEAIAKDLKRGHIRDGKLVLS